MCESTSASIGTQVQQITWNIEPANPDSATGLVGALVGTVGKVRHLQEAGGNTATCFLGDEAVGEAATSGSCCEVG